MSSKYITDLTEDEKNSQRFGSVEYLDSKDLKKEEGSSKKRMAKKMAKKKKRN